jgi:hypothetical protein
MASNVNGALVTFDALYAHLTADSGPPDTNAEPFRIQDYTEAAQEIDALAQRLREVLLTFDQILGSTNILRLTEQLGPAVQKAEATSKGVVDYAFARAVLLICIACGAVLITFVAARWLGRKVRPAPSKGAAGD